MPLNTLGHVESMGDIMDLPNKYVKLIDFIALIAINY